ncbi:MAG: hypothetical protein AAGJ82_07655, partial [Bacteroidota bacterium]
WKDWRVQRAGKPQKLSQAIRHIPWRKVFGLSWLDPVLEKTVSIMLKLGTLFLVVFFLLFFFRLFQDQGYVIHAFNMPKELMEQGMTGQIFAMRVQETLADLKEEAGSVKEDSLQLKEGQEDLDLSVLGVGLSVRGVALQLREVLGRENQTLKGEVLHIDDTYTAQIRLTGYNNITKSVPIEAAGKAAALDELLRELAKGILYETDPYRLVLIHRNEGKDDEAVAVIRYILRDHPEESHWAFLAWGNLLNDQKDYAGSLKKYDAALSFKPDFELAWYNKIDSYIRLEDHEGQLRAIRKSLELAPDNFWRWNTYVWILNNQEQYEQVDSLMPIILARTELDKDERLYGIGKWAEMRLERGDPLGAKAVLDEYFTDYGENITSYVVRGVTSIMGKDTVEGLNLLSQAIELDPGSNESINPAIYFGHKLRKHRYVADVYYKADMEALWPSNRAQILNTVAMSMNHLAQHDTAFMLARQALTIDTTAIYPYTTLAETYAFTGQLDSCFHFLEFALENDFDLENLDWTIEPYATLKDHPEMQRLIRRFQPEKDPELASTKVNG